MGAPWSASVAERLLLVLRREGTGRQDGFVRTSAQEAAVARLKIAYVGGGSTRAAGTMASFIEQGENYAGSEMVLIDLDTERLALLSPPPRRMAAAPRGGAPRPAAT